MYGIFGRKRNQDSYYSVGSYLPIKKKARKLRGADYLYVVIVVLIVTGLIQKIQIDQLKALAASSKTVVMGMAAKVTPTTIIKYVEKEDSRVAKLAAYLTGKQSPLLPHAALIVSESDKHGIDYTLMVSISGMESSFGKNAKQSCHNPFGLGGTKPLCFASWEEAISFEAGLLDRDYRINMANGIQSKYCPAEECNPEWSSTIVGFSKEIMKGGENK